MLSVTIKLLCYLRISKENVLYLIFLNLPSHNFFNIYSTPSLQTSPGAVTTASGAPIGIKDATMTVGLNGPVLIQNFNFLDEMSHFDRERILERVVHAKGALGQIHLRQGL